MTDDTGSKEADEQYAVAHALHYETKVLREALGRYKAIMAAHPNTQQAGYCRSQIQNIVRAVVPEQELLDAEVALALAHV